MVGIANGMLRTREVRERWTLDYWTEWPNVQSLKV